MAYREYTQTELEQILDYSSYDPDDYSDWIEAGIILNSYDENIGFDLWDQWSSRSSKYDPEEIIKKWESFKPDKTNGLTIGTLIQKAKDNGYHFKAGNTEEFEWDDVIEYDRAPVYSGDQVENSRIKARLRAKKKAEPQQEQPTKHTNNNSTTDNKDKELERILQALEADNGTFKNLIDKAQKELANSETAQQYYKSRGISQKTIEHYSAGWIENLGSEKITGPLIPGSYEGWGQRNINYEKNKNTRKYNKPSSKYDGAIDIPIGLKHVIKQPDIKDPATGYTIPLFVFEGYFDVLSLYEATGIDGISLNGIGNIGRVIKVLQHYGIDRPIYLALDNDKTGEKTNRKRYEDLLEAGFTVYWNTEFYGKHKDANEFLTKDRPGFIEAIEEGKTYFYRMIEEGFNRNYRDKFKEYVNDSIHRPQYPTGFKTLDGPGFLDGGLPPGLIGIGALSSLGKTSFVLQIADNMASNGIPVLYVSLEMSRYELMAKSISRYLYESTYIPEERHAVFECSTLEILDRKKQADFSQDKLENIEGATEMYFNDTGDTLRIIEGKQNITVEDIKDQVKQQYEFTGTAPVVIVDYLQLLEKSRKSNRNDTDKKIIDDNVKTLKYLAQEYGIPVIFISSFNRQNSDKEGEFKSFMGSAGIEYTCDVLISLERNIKLTEKQKANEKNETFFYKQNTKKAIVKEKKTGIKWLRARILKNRNGEPNGLMGLVFDAKNNHFHDYGEIYEETGTTEPPKEQSERHDNILHGKTTIQESPEPPEVYGLI